jgi:hypothetical protein
MRINRLKHVIERFSLLFEGLSHQKPRRKMRFLVLTLIVCVFSSLIYVSISAHLFSTTIGSRGVVKTLGVGVYWDEECASAVSQIDWGVIEPGLSTNVAVYIRNEGNVPSYILLSTTNWDPPCTSEFMTLSWDCSGQALQPNEAIKTTLILSVSNALQNVTDFDLDIVIAQIG